MCGLFTQADPALWKPSTRSLRIDGFVTSIRLEKFFWDILEEIGLRDQLTIPQLIRKLYLESMDAEHDLGNFTSFLRVCCARYLALAAEGQLQRNEKTSLEPVGEAGAEEIADTGIVVDENQLVH